MIKRNRLDILPPDDLLAAIDLWRRTQDPIPSQAAAVRALVRMALQSEASARNLRALAVSRPRMKYKGSTHD